MRLIRPIEIGAAFLLAPVAMLAPLGLAPLFVALGATSALALARDPARPPIPRDPWTIALGCLALWGVASIAWAVDPGHSAERAARLVGEALLTLAVVLRARGFDSTEWGARLDAAAWGLALAALLALVEVGSDGLISGMLTPRRGPSGTDRGATILAILFLPIPWRLAATKRVRLAIPLALATACGVLFLHSDAAKLALALAIVGAGAGWLGGARALRVAAVALGLAILAAPLAVATLDTPGRIEAAATRLKPSAIHRLVIWEWTAARIEEGWVIGRGLEASRSIPEGRAMVALPGSGLMVESLPLHPHNAALELWIDLGLPGAVLGALILALPVWPAGRDVGRARVAVRLGAITAMVVVGGLSYGFWQSWWDAGLVMTGLLTAGASRPEAA